MLQNLKGSFDLAVCYVPPTLSAQAMLLWNFSAVTDLEQRAHLLSSRCFLIHIAM